MHSFLAKSLPALPLALLPLVALTATPSVTLKPTPVAAAAATAVAPQSATDARKPITHDVYATWRSIQGTQLSRDGRWLAYALVAQESDGELVLRRMDGAGDAQEWRTPRGTAPAFSADGRYVAFAVQPTRADIEQAKKDKKKPDEAPKAGAALMDLATGKIELVERVKRFAWAKDGSAHLAMLLEAPLKKDAKDAKGDAKNESKADLADGFDADQEAAGDGLTGPAAKKTPGTELLLIEAATLKRHAIKDVADFVWSRDGSKLAWTVSVKEPTPAPAKKAEAAAPAASAAAPAAPASAASAVVDASTGAAPATATVAKAASVDETAREGVYVIDPSRPTEVTTLLAGAGSYRQLRFDEDGRQLAVLSDRDQVAVVAAAKRKAKDTKDTKESKDAEKDKDIRPEPAVYKLFLWRAGEPGASLLVSAETTGMPAGWSPSEHAPLAFSKDGRRLFLSTWPTPKLEPKDAPEPVKVDLWHWKDPELQSAQKARAEREKVRSYRAVVQLGATPAASRLVQLANKELPTVTINDNARYALGISELPYRQLMSWEGRYVDAYAVDLETGQARLVGKKLRTPPTLSPAGRYVLGFDANARRWLAWRTDTGAETNLTGRIQARFDDTERDVPDLPEPYGVAGWTADDASVVLYDQFDLWGVRPDTAQAVNLTRGAGRRLRIELRHVALDTEDADKKPLPADRWVLSGTHDVTRASGYWAVDANGGAPVALVQADKMIGGLIKAKDADRVVLTEQTFAEFPDLWTSTLAKDAMPAPVKISAANPQQAQLNWGTQELIEYTTADGKKLRALLAKPQDFDPKKRYPLMVYIYEKMTDNRYRFVPPAPSQNINVSRYVSNGYIVLRPDIVYTTGHPGQSAMNTVLPAIRQVVAQGYVDPKRVGIQGHSWGAYQINYLITHTTMFAAAEAGASMANMVSGYGGIRWGAGISRAFQYEHGQSRMGVAPWQRPDLYVENSPIFRVDRVTTPYLTIHNDDDDAVPWYQGIEFFTALRRLGKEAYWFNYNGEKHGLKDREHMKHYTVHMAEFFDHFLLGTPRAEWMDQPVPYLERGKRDVMGQFKPAAPAGGSTATAAPKATDAAAADKPVPAK